MADHLIYSHCGGCGGNPVNHCHPLDDVKGKGGDLTASYLLSFPVCLTEEGKVLVGFEPGREGNGCNLCTIMFITALHWNKEVKGELLSLDSIEPIRSNKILAKF